MKGLERLEVIQNLSRKNQKWVFTDIFRILRKKDLWVLAYENIKSNQGSLTPGVTKDTLDGFNLDRLNKIQQEVLNESYRFQPVRQIQIPKANGKFRPLGIPTPNDKIVQEIIRMVLAAIYEPIFDERSFGFRKGKGVHDALEYVEKKFRWVDWVIKGDISNAYPTIEHNKLCEILELRIQDPRFMRLIRKSLKAGVYQNPTTMYSKLGVPKGSVVSPILANIYFNELDEWVKHKADEIYEEKSNKRSPEYKHINYEIQKLVKQGDKLEPNSKERDTLIKKIKELIQRRNKIPSLVNQGVKLEYTRYADDWIIGIRGSYTTASQIQNEVSDFIKNHLKQELDLKKTKIVNIRAGKFPFLGYEIFLPRNMKIVKYKTKTSRQTLRRSTPILRFDIPVKQIVKRLHERGYITFEKNKVRPLSKSSYTTLEDIVIVNHFKSVWLGLETFYSGTTNFSNLQYIHYLLHTSCAMTLAHRHRLSSRKIFQKHGKRLEIQGIKNGKKEIVTYFPYRTSWNSLDRKWYKAKILRDPFQIYANRVSKSSLNKSCLICESKWEVEMHHVKHVRKQGSRYKGFHAEMSL